MTRNQIDTDLRTAHNQIRRWLTILDRHARADLEATAYPSPPSGPTPSGGDHPDPTAHTARALPDDGPVRTDAAKIAHAMQRAAQILEKTHQQLTPARWTGKPCRNRGCEGDGTHDGWCDRCHTYRRRNRDSTGKPIDPSPQLLADWNQRRHRDCECTVECCPDGCIDLVPPGQGRISERCLRRTGDTPCRCNHSMCPHPPGQCDNLSRGRTACGTCRSRTSRQRQPA